MSPKIFNGKYISALLDRSGDLLVFSDKNEQIEKFFPNLNLIETQISHGGVKLCTKLNLVIFVFERTLLPLKLCQPRHFAYFFERNYITKLFRIQSHILDFPEI